MKEVKKETERCDGRKTRSWSDVATEEIRIASELMVLQAQMKKEAKKEKEP